MNNKHLLRDALRKLADVYGIDSIGSDVDLVDPQARPYMMPGYKATLRWFHKKRGEVANLTISCTHLGSVAPPHTDLFERFLNELGLRYGECAMKLDRIIAQYGSVQ